MFQDMQEMEIPSTRESIVSLELCIDGEGFFLIMQEPGKEPVAGRLPEAMQNLIPVYLPMFIGQ